MSDPVELRGDCNRDVVDIIDAVAKARRMNRTQVWLEVVEQWAKEKVHEATLVTRMARGKGSDAEV